MAREDKCYCYFHPKQVVVGVCALCLHERLAILAASHNKRKSSSSSSTTSIHLPRISAFASFLNRFEFRHSKSYNHDVSASPGDSFISIKFEENGKASWEKAKVSKVALDNCTISWNHHNNNNNNNVPLTKTVIEQGKPLRWRKRIGRLFHLIKWKRSNGGNAGQVDRKKSWMPSLTMRGKKKDIKRRN